MSEVIYKNLRVEMGDGTKYDVPVYVIAKNRAEYYSSEFGGSVRESLDEDTIPLFESHEYEIIDWASNNMDWSDVEEFAIKVDEENNTDFQEGWLNGEKEIL